MLTQVKTRVFMFCRNTQAHESINTLQEQPTYHKGVNPDNNYSENLRAEKAWIAKQQAISACRVDGLRGKDPETDGADDSAHPVDTYDIERIV